MFDPMLLDELIPKSPQTENIKIALNKMLWLESVSSLFATAELSQTEEEIREVPSTFSLHMNTPFKKVPE